MNARNGICAHHPAPQCKYLSKEENDVFLWNASRSIWNSVFGMRNIYAFGFEIWKREMMMWPWVHHRPGKQRFYHKQICYGIWLNCWANKITILFTWKLSVMIVPHFVYVVWISMNVGYQISDFFFLSSKRRKQLLRFRVY